MRMCYKHAEKPNAKSCPFCSKDYCEDCLLLVGKRKTVICKDCYTILFNKIKKSTIRRYIYLLLGVIWLVLILVNFSNYFLLESPNSTIFILLGVGILYSFTVNIIRLIQYRSWNVIESYTKTIKPEVQN